MKRIKFSKAQRIEIEEQIFFKMEEYTYRLDFRSLYRDVLHPLFIKKATDSKLVQIMKVLEDE